MASQAPLIPSLYAIVPPTILSPLMAETSLMALHSEPFQIQDDMYTSTSPSAQNRTLRFRTRRSNKGTQESSTSATSGQDSGREVEVRTGKTKGKGKGKERATEADEQYSLAYVSQPLSGREYAEMNVRAILGMDILGMSDKEVLEEFIEDLGMKHSHSYIRSGYLFYLPLPNTTLSLRFTITRLYPLSSPSDPTRNTINPEYTIAGMSSMASTGDDKSKLFEGPFIAQLTPSRSVQTVAMRGEASLVEVMGMMREVAGRIDMLDWGTGRE